MNYTPITENEAVTMELGFRMYTDQKDIVITPLKDCRGVKVEGLTPWLDLVVWVNLQAIATRNRLTTFCFTDKDTLHIWEEKA